jgi:hypothetical protein
VQGAAEVSEEEAKPDVPTLPSEITDPDKQLAVAKKLLAAEKNRVAVRGYEVARLVPSGDWEQTFKYRPTHFGLQQAAGDAKWLNERYPNELYQARVLVSAELPERPTSTPETNQGAECPKD